MFRAVISNLWSVIGMFKLQGLFGAIVWMGDFF